MQYLRTLCLPVSPGFARGDELSDGFCSLLTAGSVGAWGVGQSVRRQVCVQAHGFLSCVGRVMALSCVGHVMAL